MVNSRWSSLVNHYLAAPDNRIYIYVRSLKNQKYIIKTFKEKKAAQIEQVRFMGVPISGGKKLPADSKKISITYCMKRIPEVGDKFSNNHGQKGICGFTMPDVDLPFSTSGIIPDLIFNPHGLPTRMSIGMMLEIMATKPVLVKGQKYCVQPFQFTDKDTAINEFGSFLEEVGFDYYGTEKFYSGTSGEELEADIFCGSAYYFRLHHIVEEKYQVESVNEIDPATRQPINRHTGAIRFGEMERDAILAHGANQLTLDRLLHNSDLCYASVCSSCETVLYPLLMSYNIRKSKGELEIIKELEKKFSDCRICKNSEFYRIRIPHVFYYLIIELSSIGIKVKLSKSAQEMSNDTDCIINDD